jgi:hypothetical protein
LTNLRFWNETAVPVAVGMAWTRALAKLVSDLLEPWPCSILRPKCLSWRHGR